MKWLLGAVVLLAGAYAAFAQDAGVPPPADPNIVTIRVRSLPSGARVTHGRQKLGVTPLVMTRKRGSGPMDLMLRRGGYFPVATRAYTFKDDLVIVRLTHRDNASKLHGFKAPLPPDAGPDAAAGGAPDGGVALPPSSQPIPTQP
jgi:hypothetical protein